MMNIQLKDIYLNSYVELIIFNVNFLSKELSKEEFSEVDNEEALLIFSEDYYNMSPKELGEKADLYMKENSEKCH